MRRTNRRNRARFRHRIGGQRLHRHRTVGNIVDERGVGPVLQQPAHQVRQQRLVRTHRRIDPARPVQLARPNDLFIQRLAHAVQALEFILPGMEILAKPFAMAVLANKVRHMLEA